MDELKTYTCVVVVFTQELQCQFVAYLALIKSGNLKKSFIGFFNRKYVSQHSVFDFYTI